MIHLSLVAEHSRGKASYRSRCRSGVRPASMISSRRVSKAALMKGSLSSAWPKGIRPSPTQQIGMARLVF